MLIAGSFREYPFFLLLEIFLRRRETGLLEVSSTEDSGYFYIKNGKVKDGHVGKNKGLAAIKLVAKFDDGSFQFKPLAPSDYARVIWQRSFGPTGIANDQPPSSVPATVSTISLFGSRAAYRLSNVSSTLRPIGQLLASLAGTTRRQFVLYTLVIYHTLKKNRVLLMQRAVAYATLGFALWKRAQVGTKLLRIFKKALAVPQQRRRRDRHLTSGYPHHIRFRPPSLTNRNTEAITGAVRQGLVHNVALAFVVTVLLGISGVMLHQLVFGDPDLRDAGTVDEHFQIPVNASRTRAEPKRHRNKRPATDESKGKSGEKRSAAQKPGASFTQQPGAIR
jgi:hypothetical protein